MIYSIIHNESIIFTTTNINEAHTALEEFGLSHLERLCGSCIQKKHIDFHGYYGLSLLHKVQIWRLKKGYLYNSRYLCDEYKIIRGNYKSFVNQKKLSLRAIDPNLLEQIRSFSPPSLS